MSTITTSKQNSAAQWMSQESYVGSAGHAAWEQRRHQLIRQRVLRHRVLKQEPAVLRWLEQEQERVDALALSRA